MDKFKFLLTAVVLSVFVGPASSRTRYVDTAGADAGGGGSSAPWKTLQYAADNAAPGDTFIIKPGAYAGFAMDDAHSGTKQNPIVFLASAGAVINDRNGKTADGINLEGASYIVLDGFTILNKKGRITRAGIRAVTDTGVVCRNNIADSCGTWGIFTGFSENILIEKNSASRSVQQHGIYFSNSADRPVIRGNRSYGNNGCGIHMNGDESMGGDGIISYALVENNIIWDNGRSGGSGINCDGVQHSRIQNNLLYNNHASGISLFQGNAAEAAKYDTVVNNTIIEASDARWCLNIKNGSTDAVVFNNILYNNHSWHGSVSIDAESLTGLKSDYNVVMDRLSPDDDNSVMTLAQWRTATGNDQHSLTATPAQLFANASANDYHLCAASPARGAGLPQGAPATDIEGATRPSGTNDIGCFAYNPAGIVRTALRVAPAPKTVRRRAFDLSGRQILPNSIRPGVHAKIVAE